MRTFTVYFFAIGLLLQSGCASIPSNSRLAAHRKPKPDPKTSADYVKAKDLERQGKFERARELYEQILDKDPKNSESMHRLAVVCTRLQRYGEADDYFDRAYKLAPKDASLVVDMGYSSYLRRDLDEAERLLREAVHLKPSDKRAVSNLALVIGVRGKIDESLSLLLEIDDKPTALSNLAYIHSQRGEFDLAEQRFREALAIDAKHKDATKGLADLSKLRPQQDVSIAQSKSIEREAFKPFDVEKPQEARPLVEQVSAAAANEKRAVNTANFEEEADEPAEPGLLDASQKRVARPATDKLTTAVFEDDGAIDRDQDDLSEKTVSPGRDAPALDDDWAGDAPTKTTTSSKSSRDAFDVDSPSDEEASMKRTIAPATTADGDQSKFMPFKSQSNRTTRIPANKKDQPFVIEERMVE